MCKQPAPGHEASYQSIVLYVVPPVFWSMKVEVLLVVIVGVFFKSKAKRLLFLHNLVASFQIDYGVYRGKKIVKIMLMSCSIQYSLYS